MNSDIQALDGGKVSVSVQKRADDNVNVKAQALQDGEFSSNIDNGGSGDVNADVNALALDDGKASFNVEDGDNDGSGDLDAQVNDVANDGGEANLSGKLQQCSIAHECFLSWY